MTNTNRSNTHGVADNIMKRNYSRFRLMLHAAVGCALAAGMSGLTSAQIIKLPVTKTITYTLTDLNLDLSAYGTSPYTIPTGPPSPWWGDAYAIDNAGQVVGQFVNLTGAYHAFRTQPNMPINYLAGDDLGVLTGATSSLAYAVNSTGVAVGDSVIRAIRSIPGYALDDLNTTSPPNMLVIGNATETHARGINDAGWIVGYFVKKTSTSPTGYTSGSFISFGPGWTQPIDFWYGNPYESETLDVNNRGQVVGWLTATASDNLTAFLCNTGGGLIKIGILLRGTWSQAFALNDSGQVVGQSDTETPSNVHVLHAFLFQDLNNNGIADPGEMKDLDPAGTVESAALSINNSGTAVGYFGSGCSELCDHRTAAIFANGAKTDLNSLVQGGTAGWTLKVARGINDLGQIVGLMQNDTSGLTHAFRLDPVSPVRKP